MAENFGYKAGNAVVALKDDNYYIWDCSVVYSGGEYHMFSSRWKRELGFVANWLFNSEIIHSVSKTPEGPYEFRNVVLPRRERKYFDGMNTHNTCIKEHGGKFYLYYMGCTYAMDPPAPKVDATKEEFIEVWNKKRIGLAVASDINGEFVRRDTPLLEPRDCSYWDCTATTNPSVAIKPDGETFMIYKSRQGCNKPMQLGIARANTPDGEFTRLSDEPILKFENPNFQMEDPFIWYDNKKGKFCLIAKDCCMTGGSGITDEWGSGFYAESDDCMEFTVAPDPKVYSRHLTWSDGTKSTVCNLERPSLLFDENGNPTHLFCALGDGDEPYQFDNPTFIVCIKLEKI